MCLAIPMKLIKIKGEMGLVEVGNVRREVGLQLVEDVKAGDYLIVHAGFAIQKLDEKDALETLALFREMENLG
jgi:hydrogenase expression/formation protein HypC